MEKQLNMEELEKYELINKCETDNELAQAILLLSDKEGMVKGRNKAFAAEKMAGSCHLVINKNYPPNLLTREYGIRQQALYIKYYTHP
jgi:hypothetical protein